MKHRSFITVFLLIAMFVFSQISNQNANVNAGATTVSAIAFNITNATVGDTVILSVEFSPALVANYIIAVLVVDNGTGISPFTNLYLYPSASGGFEGNFTVESYYTPGNVTVDSMTDDYYSNIFVGGMDYTSPFVVISGTTPDVTAPVLLDLYFDKTTVSFDQNITLFAEIQDVSPVDASFQLLEQSTNFVIADYVMEFVANNTYKTVIQIDLNFYVDTYIVQNFYMADFSGNDAYPATNASFDVVNQPVSDTTPPVIGNSFFDQYNVTQGQTVTLSTDVFDDSPISSVRFGLSKSSDLSEVGTYQMSLVSGNTYEGSVSINSSFMPDEYFVYWIEAIDSENNKATVNFSIIDAPSFNVYDNKTATTDTAPPTLVSSGFNASEVLQNETVLFSAQITDESEISSAKVQIVSENSAIMGWYAMQLVNGSYQATIFVNSSFSEGTSYFAETVEAMDEYGNTMQSSTNNAFKVDFPGPSLLNLTFNGTEVEVGKAFKAIAEFDNPDIVVSVEIWFSQDNETAEPYALTRTQNDTFEASIQMDNLEGGKEIFVSSIKITDIHSKTTINNYDQNNSIAKIEVVNPLFIYIDEYLGVLENPFELKDIGDRLNEAYVKIRLYSRYKIEEFMVLITSVDLDHPDPGYVTTVSNKKVKLFEKVGIYKNIEAMIFTFDIIVQFTKGYVSEMKFQDEMGNIFYRNYTEADFKTNSNVIQLVKLEESGFTLVSGIFVLIAFVSLLHKRRRK